MNITKEFIEEHLIKDNKLNSHKFKRYTREEQIKIYMIFNNIKLKTENL